MKILYILVLSLSFVAPALAAQDTCSNEGQRDYRSVPGTNNYDVYVCENGQWEFLYTQTPGSPSDD